MRVVATAGHVDHGKSALVERLTGVHPDRWAEERRRGLTIDLGFGHTTVTASDGSAHEVSLVDVPGHVRFLRNMLAGVGAVDACMFVVDAGEGWKPQSEEHLRILQLLGIGHGIVVLTKRDLVDDDLLELQELDVRDHLAGTFLADAPVVAVSTLPGFEPTLDALRAVLADLAARTPAAADRDRPRLWIDRVFAARGSGTVVTGTLTGGSLRVDQQVVAGHRPVRIRGLQSHGAAREQVGPGSRVAVNLAGIDHTELHRGDAVIDRAQWRPTRRFDARLEVLASLDHAVTRRGSYLAYIGSGEFPVRLRVLGTESLTPGTHGSVRLHLLAESPLPLLPGDRFVLRESGRDETVGGGEVLDVQPRRPAARARPDRSVDRVIAEHGWIDVEDLEALTGERREPTVGTMVVDPAALDTTIAIVRTRVADAGDAGLDIALLEPRERGVLPLLDDLTVESGRVRAAAARDPFATHPVREQVRLGGCAPPDAATLDRAAVRELVRRGLLVERDGLVFHPDAIDVAALAAARLLSASPTGFTVSEFREALGITRKHAVPLAAELDARGITRRREDRRIAGPRLPSP
ncbi:MAG: selenocysteine-specific translation elongation factor [Ilumatobacteraceae bacterium]